MYSLLVDISGIGFRPDSPDNTVDNDMKPPDETVRPARGNTHRNRPCDTGETGTDAGGGPHRDTSP